MCSSLRTSIALATAVVAIAAFGQNADGQVLPNAAEVETARYRKSIEFFEAAWQTWLAETACK
jgi:hypothetical protein